MSIFSTPLGMNSVDNPLLSSPFVQGSSINGSPIVVGDFIIMETGEKIITETSDFLIVE